MQGTTDLHHQIADTLLPQTDAVFDDAAALDTAVHMLDAEPAVVQRLIGLFLLPCQLLAPWLFGRHEDLHLGERERQEAEILSQPAPGR
jgi:hypothetical protein